MEYLTAADMCKKWNVSSRMAAYYCESGRIEGAVKAGKTWLIPANAAKPADRRRSKRKAVVGKTDDFGGENSNINQADIDNISTLYRAGDVYENLGLTRETLRYYEEIGLITPKRNSESNYREFDFFDISHLMAVDFYKKRGFAPIEIKELMKASTQAEYSRIMERQLDRLEGDIEHLRKMQRRLEETKRFCDSFDGEIGEFTVKDFPLYYVREQLGSVSSFDDYKDKVLNYINLKNEDILSNMVRMITFDETGYKGSEMCIVKPASQTGQERGDVFLEDGKCLYTTLAADNDDNSVMEKMFLRGYEWAAEHNVSFKGVVYIFIRFIMMNGSAERNYYEVWIPLK